MNQPEPPPPPDRAVVLFGKPGAGKGTQGRLLAATPGLVHVDMGDVLREHRDRPAIAERLEQGELIPDDVVLRLLDAHLDELVRGGVYEPGRDLLVLDGVPRTTDQAEALERRMRVLAVVVLRCDDADVLRERLQRRAADSDRRDDAAPDVVEERFREDEQRTRPVLDWYGSRRVIEVDAGRRPTTVRDAIVRSIAPLLRGVPADSLEAPR